MPMTAQGIPVNLCGLARQAVKVDATPWFEWSFF